MADGLLSLGTSAQALSLRAARMTVLAGNIANASTPGFKARDIDFGAAMQAAPDAATAMAPPILYRAGPANGLDGNSVDLAHEQLAYAENAVGFRTAIEFLNGRIATLRRSLKGE